MSDDNLITRNIQTWTIALLVFTTIFVAAFGIYTLYRSPLLSIHSNSLFHFNIHNVYSIYKLDDIELDPLFFNRFPEFFFPKEEKRWWQKQEEVYELLSEKRFVTIEAKVNDAVRKIKAEVTFATLIEILKQTGLVYLVALIFIISALYVFKRHSYSTGSLLLTLFLLCVSLYFTSSIPITVRSIILVPRYFKILINVVYISAGGLITLVHFAFVFPRKKELLVKLPFLPYILYGYFALTIILYLSHTIAFGTTFPFLCFWVFVMTSAFVHSFLREKDIFLKKQIFLSTLAPFLVGIAFIFLHLLPGILGVNPIGFTHFALFSLIIPFCLPQAMDNLRLYNERLTMEHNANRERERIRQDLHDSTLNDLANISISSEVSLNFLEKSDGSLAMAREKIETIRNLARESSLQIRGFLRVTDESQNTWEDFCGQMRRYGYELLKHLDIEFDLNILKGSQNFQSLSISIRECLYLVFKEAMTNIIKHSCANKAEAIFYCENNLMNLEIKDNGKGFDRAHIEDGHYGLKNIEKRVTELKGTVGICTKPNNGTILTFRIPLAQNTAIGG